jgi:hemerythrin-like metal-binding protein
VLNWNADRHALGVPAMDDNHRDFLVLVDAVAAAVGDDFVRCLEDLMEHTRVHFAAESDLMRACGFAAIAEHENEHRRVLGDLVRLYTGVGRGRATPARIYVSQGLPDWFEQHLATMDSALAACLKCQ